MKKNIGPVSSLLFFSIVFLISLFPYPLSIAQQEAPAIFPEILKQGGVTPQQAQEAIQKGQATPEAIQQFQKEVGIGTLTPAEIEAGKKALEQQKPADTALKPAEPQKEIKPPQSETKAEPEKKILEPLKEVLPPETEAKTMEAMKEKAMIEAEDAFFKKIPGPETPVLELFGHRLFSTPPTTFAPVTTVPVSNDYIIGPGDEIKVLMWGRMDASYSLEVDNEGVINFPKIGPLTIAGLTFGEVKELIKAKAEAITGVSVSVSMGKLRTIQVFILGEVKGPGLYTVSSLATVTNALLFSGGPTPLGSLRKVQLKRQGKTILMIDLYDLLLNGDTSSDKRLMPGDTIFVPQASTLVGVSGNVRRPAMYEMKDDKSLQYALELAGGLKPQAYNQRIKIERAYENQVQIVLDISSEELQQKKSIPLQDGDLVRVFSIRPYSINAVYLYGNVIRPGEYAHRPGLRILDILPDAKSLEMDTYFDYAMIKRPRFESGKSELIPFNLGKLLFSKEMNQNLILMPLDEIYVFNRQMFQDREYAEVEGQVRKPGRYLIDDMKVRDLIRKAGDLADPAYLPKGEIIRNNKDHTKQTLYFDVAAAMADDPDHNIRVQGRDRVVIHSVWETKWKEAVTIKGEIKNPASYDLTRGMKVSDLIFKSGQFTRDAYMELGHIYRTDWLTKDVTIFTFNVRKAMERDPDHDLLLKDIDEVLIHSLWEYIDKYTVSLRGTVNKPGEYPYAVNMTVKDLILLGGYLKESAFLEKGELIRYEIVAGTKIETSLLSFDISKAMQGDLNHNLLLKPFDTLIVKEIPEWKERKTVTITGEVYFPGIYTIRKDERLSDLIVRAGGLSEYAYPRAATFTREAIKGVQQERLNEMIKTIELDITQFSSKEAQATVSTEDLAAQTQFLTAQKALVAKLRESKPTGRVIISLLPTGTIKETSLDMALEDKDTLHIPRRPGTVNVLGAVFNPSAILFDESRPNLDYYLQRTGGPTENAESGNIYVVRADGTVISKSSSSWFGTSWDEGEKRWSFWGGGFGDTRLFPGDTVLVPQKIARPSYMRDFKDITQILYQIAVTAGITITQVF